jgi:hypothetical protein
LVKIALIFTFHILKSLLPVHFSISHFEPMVLNYRSTPIVPRWAPIVDLSKNHTNKELDVWNKYNKQPISYGIEIMIIQKKITTRIRRKCTRRKTQ